MNLPHFQTLGAISICAIGLGFGLAPFFCCKSESKHSYSLLHAFSSGVFFAVAFLDMLPDAIAAFRVLSQPVHPILLASLIALSGFLFILCIQFLVHRLRKPKASRPPPERPDEEIQLMNNQSPQAELNHANSRLIRALFLTLASGVHSVMAGLALGLVTNIHQAYSIFIAIISHKWSESLAIGSSYPPTKPQRTIGIITICFLATLAPLGVVIGASVSQQNPLVSGTMISLAAGMFVYLAGEIIWDEVKSREQIWMKLLFLALGFALILILVLLF